jgi:hypothetical protein
MSMDYIRRAYGVPAARGGRVIYTDEAGRAWPGVITSARAGCLVVRMGGRGWVRLHPTWRVTYLQPARGRSEQ